jgi:hypothetical protein
MLFILRMFLQSIYQANNICALWYSIYDTYQLLHVSAPRYHPQYISQHANLDLPLLIRMDEILKSYNT